MPVPGALAMVTPARPVDVKDARHPQEGLWIEIKWIQVIVVHASVNDVDGRVPLGGPHGDASIDHAQIMTFNKFGPHLAS